MSEASDNPKPFHLVEGGNMGFGDDGAPVSVVWPQFDEPEQRADVSQEALEWLRIGLLVALEGRPDGIASRTAALAVIAGLFDSAASAADKLGLDRKAVSRAEAAIIARLKSQEKNHNHIENID